MTQDVHTLSRLALFRGVELPEVERIVAAGRIHEVERGEMVAREGANAKRVHVIISGGVRRIKVSPEGGQLLVGFSGPGRVVGAEAMLGHERFFASAIAIGSTAVLSWEGEQLRTMLTESRALLVNILRQNQRDLAACWTRFRDLATQSVEGRVARELLQLAEDFGREVDDGVLIDLYLRREDLAQMIGSTVPTVSRIVARWSEAGLVRSVKSRRIVILAKTELERVSRMRDRRSR